MYWDQNPQVLTLEKLLQTKLEFDKKFGDVVTAWHMHPDTLSAFNKLLDRNPEVKKLVDPQDTPLGLIGGINLIPDDAVSPGWRHEYSVSKLVRVVDMRRKS